MIFHYQQHFFIFQWMQWDVCAIGFSKATLKFGRVFIHEDSHLSMHTFFKYVWQCFKNADWSVITFRVLRTLSKNWGNISHFENWWKGSFIDWSIKQEMKNLSAFSLIFFVSISDSWHAFVDFRLLNFFKIFFSVLNIKRE